MTVGYTRQGRKHNFSSLTLASSLAPRVRRLAEHLHRLGPRPLYEFLSEVIQGADALERLEVYSRLAAHADFIRAHDGDRLPTLFVIEGGSS
jgi:hypothetical protein